MEYNNNLGMDSFDRNIECECANTMYSKTVDVSSPRFLTLDNLKFYNDNIVVNNYINANRVKFDDGKDLAEVIREIVQRFPLDSVIPQDSINSFSCLGRLKRADLNLVFGK